MTTSEILKNAKKAVRIMSSLDTDKKNTALASMANALIEYSDNILSANAEDLKNAEGKISEVMTDRLMLNPERINTMAEGIRDVIKLEDPVNIILDTIKRPNGLIIEKISVPMGVVAMIYESRPNVTSDAAALSLKSGNVSVLRSGKEAFGTSFAIVEAMQKGLQKTGLPAELINIIEDTSRDSAYELMTAAEYVDLLIPRGGAGLINACVSNAKVPCIQTGTGICHIFVDETADIDKALNIINNAKTSRPSVCNAEEVLLVHKNIAQKFLPLLKNKLYDSRISKGLKPVELRLDEKSQKIISGKRAYPSDFDTEFLDYILAIKIADSLDDAIEHILKHSTKHSDCIITESEQNADLFTKAIDSSSVYVNASTRFTDGGEFGLGCEIGISTQKLHARGPMGLKELTTYKYIIKGNGQIR